MKYILIKKLKIAFANVAKCGTCSLKDLALTYDYPEYSYTLNPRADYIFSHLHQVNFAGIEVTCIAEDVPSDYRSILFVRNPFDRVASGYKHFVALQAGESHRLSTLMKKITFKQMVLQYLYSISCVDHHFFSIIKVIRKCLENTEIYRFENFGEEMKNILQIDNIPHLNKTSNNKEGYRGIYTLKTKLVVQDLYKWDFNNLGYNFNGYKDIKLDIKKLKEKSKP